MRIVTGRAAAVWKRRYIVSLATTIVMAASLASPVASQVEVSAASVAAPIVWQRANAPIMGSTFVASSSQTALIRLGYCPGGMSPCP